MNQITRIGILVLLLGLFSNGSATAEPVQVSGAIKEDYGLITFRWNSPVGHKLIVGQRSFSVEFSRPIEASYQSTVNALKGYVDKGSGNATRVTFGLAADFEVYSYDSGASVFVEVVPREGTAPANPTSQPNQQEVTAEVTPADGGMEGPQAVQSTLPSIGIRTGVYDTYTRVVFDWTSKVGYSFANQGGVVTLEFDKPANLQTEKLTPRPPNLVGEVRTNISDKSVQMMMGIPSGSTVKHFLSGTKVVVDIRIPEAGGQPVKLPEAADTQELAKSLPQSQSAPVQEATEPPETEPQAVAQTAPPTEPTGAPEPESGPRALVAGGGEVPSSTLLTQSIAGAGLRFDWAEPVAAAVFRRAGVLWVAFDKPSQIDVEALKTAGGDAITSVQQVPNKRGTVIRMVTPPGINPTLARNGNAWELTFGKQELETATPIVANAQPNSPVGARIFIPTSQPGRAIGVTDPDVGDNLVIVPLVSLGHGVAREYIYPQVRILPSAQGVVIEPRADDIRVRPRRQGVELTSKELKVSPTNPEDAGKSQVAAGELSTILDLEKWAVSKENNFLTQKRSLQQALNVAKGINIERARYNLANFYFANRYSAELLGVLERMKFIRPEIEEEAEFRLLRAGANYFLARYTEADQDLQHASLQSNDEADLWMSLVISKLQTPGVKALELRKVRPITEKYPTPLRIPIQLVIAEAALEIGDIKNAKEILESLKKLPPSAAQLFEIAYLEGSMFEQSGDFEAAIEKWDEVKASNHRPSRVKAVVASMELLLKQERMEKPEAIEELESLRFVWRGDDFEFDLLRRLGGLYLETNNFRFGLQTLKQAATYFRSHKDATTITQQMANTFSYLYQDEGADILAPVRAIAIYEEFKELTPAGAKGDEMIRKLADRLVEVDLLDQAAGLLAGQVNFRLNGVQKAEVGARLAVVHLLAREYQMVIKTLDETNEQGQPQELQAQRRHVRARALIGLRKRDEALVLLNNDKTADADLLRAEVYWSLADWSKSAQFLQRVLRASGGRAKTPLTDIQAVNVLNLSTAMTLNGNERGLGRVRSDYGGAMANTKYAEAFSLVVAPPPTGLISPESVSQRVKLAENFMDFLGKYHERIKSESLSEIVPSLTTAAAGEAMPRS